MVLSAAEYMTGSSGTEVSQIQAALAFAGYLQTAPDGVYGPKTKEAVQRFQSDKGLAIDGIVGPNTWAALFGSGAPPVAPTVIQRPTPSSIPSSVVMPAGGLSGMFAGLTQIQMIAGGLAVMVLASMGLKAPGGKRKRRR